MVPEAKFSLDCRSGRDRLRASKPLRYSLIREVVSILILTSAAHRTHASSLAPRRLLRNAMLFQYRGTICHFWETLQSSVT